MSKSQKLEFEILRAVVTKSPIMWDITPYRTLYVNPTFRRDDCVCYMLHCYGFMLGLFFTLKIVAPRYSEMSAVFQMITWRYVSEGRIFKSRHL